MIYGQVFSTSNVQNGTLRYRIEVRMPGQGMYQHRHIWLAGNNSYGHVATQIETGEWIPSLKCIFDDIRVRGYEVSDVLPSVDSRGRALPQPTF